MKNSYRKLYFLIFSVMLISVAYGFTFAQPEEFKDPMLKDSDTDGGIGFEKIATSLGWETNTNIDMGDSNAKKGGTLTMLGGATFPKTYRAIGKDTRQQINSLMESMQYDPLLSYDYENLEWEPNLATHWKMESDSITYRFRLDPNARWSDGREVTSKDVVAYYNLLVDPGHKDPNVSKWYEEYFEVPIAESKYIVKIVAKKKDWRVFRYAAGFTPWPSFYLDEIDGAGYIEKYNYSFMPVSGPYQFNPSKSKKGTDGYLVFEKREDYWAKDYDRVKNFNNFDEIKFIFIEDENQQAVSFLNGDYDIYLSGRAQWWVEKFTATESKEIDLGWVQKLKVFNSLPKGPSGIVFNTRIEPWDDVNVRKAFAHLFDVKKLNKRLFFGEYSQLNTFFFGTPYANPDNPYTSFNPNKALNLLKKAGWTVKSGDTRLTNASGEPFEFKFLISTGEDRIYSSFQQDLANIGITMEFDQMDASGAFAKTMKKQFEVTSQGWTAGFFPSMEGMMHSKYADDIEVTNITSMNIPELDELIDQYNQEWDAQKRIPIAHKIDEIAVKSYHYAMGWTSPYGARLLFWNKFGIPETGISYVGDWRSPIGMWWIEPDKERNLQKAKEGQTSLDSPNIGYKSPDGDWIEIDHWNKKP